MALQKSATRKSTAKPKGKPKRYHVRLARLGEHGQFGLGRYYYGGRLYVRSRIYTVDGPTMQRLHRTGKFEVIPEHLLEMAIRQAREPRGPSIDKMLRHKRRQAAARRRPYLAQPQLLDEDDDSDVLDEPLDPQAGEESEGEGGDEGGEGTGVEV